VHMNEDLIDAVHAIYDNDRKEKEQKEADKIQKEKDTRQKENERRQAYDLQLKDPNSEAYKNDHTNWYAPLEIPHDELHKFFKSGNGKRSKKSKTNKKSKNNEERIHINEEVNPMNIFK
jgi:hypothetical protein